MFGWKKRRRERIRRRPFPPEWLAIVLRNAPFAGYLPRRDREKLLGNILVFLAEKNFEGCGGLTLTDEIRVTIAAQACLLTLRLEEPYYPRLRSILVYPRGYRAASRKSEPGGMISEGVEDRTGESWPTGAVVLSWDDVRKSGTDYRSGHNLALHEFAHQLDQEDGAADGVPILRCPARYAAWAKVLGEEYRRLVDGLDAGHHSAIDPYGAMNPAEFFAVVTELFFERPRRLRRGHRELYEQLKSFYRLDPAELLNPRN